MKCVIKEPARDSTIFALLDGKVIEGMKKHFVLPSFDCLSLELILMGLVTYAGTITSMRWSPDSEFLAIVLSFDGKELAPHEVNCLPQCWSHKAPELQEVNCSKRHSYSSKGLQNQ